MQQSRTRKGRLLAVAGMTLVLAACSSGPSAAPVTTAAPAAIGPMTAAVFMEAAASAALYAVRAAELAEQRSGDSEVRALARLQKENGEGIAGQLSYAGRRLNLLPSARLMPEHQAMIDRLSAASDFDAEYLRQQEEMVPETLRLHRAYAVGGGSPTLRPVAELGADMLERQEEALDEAD